MQRIIKLWRASTGGKIAIMAGSVVSLCLLCVGFGSLLPSAPEPTADLSVAQTVAFQTALASMVVPSPSSTSAPTLTTVPTFANVTLDDYPRVAASRFQTLKEAFTDLVDVHQQLAADVTVSQNDDWYVHAVATLERVIIGANELAAMNNFPPEYQTFHSEMALMSSEGKELLSNYMLALDNQDATALNNATVNLTNMIGQLNNGTNAMSWAAATSTPLATKTSLPTATLVVVFPTSAPAVDVCSCAGDTLNCNHFGSHGSAQACFNYCVQQGRGDIHNLDSDGDGDACESL